MTPPHKSSSGLQGDVELKMLKILGKSIGVTLKRKRVAYLAETMEIDGVDVDEAVFVEASARVDVFKSGQ